jgi:hypothetical protein
MNYILYSLTVYMTMIANEYVETDPDNDGGTRNTKKGSELYYNIENIIENIK